MTLWSKEQESMFSGTSLGPRCYESHKPLKLGSGLLYGGSASSPVPKDADVYVSLQSGSASGRSADPWEEAGGPVEVFFWISDMRAPNDPKRFKKMITWLCTQLHAGLKVHVGCIGGHGRTGTVFTAIIAEMTGEKDAIQYVRKYYCKRAVESREQIAFLMKHYGVSEAIATKGEASSGSRKYNGSGFGGSDHSAYSYGTEGKKSANRFFPGMGDSRAQELDDMLPRPRLNKSRKIIPEGVTSKSKSYQPMESPRSLWKARKA
jgi:hypothetical protein